VCVKPLELWIRRKCVTANAHVLQRLEGIQTQLLGTYQAGRSISSTTKGLERETFINSFLSEVFPTPFRFGTGDATDIHGAKSGQLDVVIEYPFAPSLPIVGSRTTRLFLAESVAAVIEVKSDVASQWNEALRTASALEPITRSFQSGMSFGPQFQRIPLFVVGYTGWKNVQTVQSNLENATGISGVLVIDAGIFVASPEFNITVQPGPWSLWGLISCLHLATQSLQAASTEPFQYAI
jgi:hypothetical protein